MCVSVCFPLLFPLPQFFLIWFSLKMPAVFDVFLFNQLDIHRNPLLFNQIKPSLSFFLFFGCVNYSHV